MDLAAVLLACAPLVAPTTAHALVHVESGGNAFAIGVVGGQLVRQPRHLAEALATVRSLEAGGWNYSLGIAQINKGNFARLGLTPEAAFEPCANARAMQTVLGECFERASRKSTDQTALRHALSCYYSGNFSTGYRDGYVDRVFAAWRAKNAATRKEAPSQEPRSPMSPSLMSSNGQPTP